MIHGILEMEGVPFLQRLPKCRLGTRALTEPLCVSAPLLGNPVVYVGRTMNDADPSGLTSAEETHRVDIHQAQFLQVQNNPCSAVTNLSLQLLHMLRLHSANQPDRRAMLIRHWVDSQGHPPG